MATNDPRHLHEADADEKADLLAENRRLSEELAAANERIAALESILQVLVNFGWLDVNQYGNAHECQHCNIEAQLGVNLDEYPHAPNCVIAQARALLGEDGT